MSHKTSPAESNGELSNAELTNVVGGFDTTGWRPSTNVEDHRGGQSPYRATKDGYLIGPQGEYMNNFSFEELFPQTFAQDKGVGQWVNKTTGEGAPPDQAASSEAMSPEYQHALSELSEMTQHPQAQDLPEVQPYTPPHYQRGEFVPMFPGDAPRTGGVPEELVDDPRR